MSKIETIAYGKWVTAKTAVTECGEPHQLISEITVAKYGNPSTAY